VNSKLVSSFWFLVSGLSIKFPFFGFQFIACAGAVPQTTN